VGFANLSKYNVGKRKRRPQLVTMDDGLPWAAEMPSREVRIKL
jgi:hypothetical protein